MLTSTSLLGSGSRSITPLITLSLVYRLLEYAPFGQDPMHSSFLMPLATAALRQNLRVYIGVQGGFAKTAVSRWIFENSVSFPRALIR